MYPTDSETISSLPEKRQSIIFGTVIGLTTVILGTSLLKISPLSKPVHLLLGGGFGALGGGTLHWMAESFQERVKLGVNYYRSKLPKPE